VYACMCEYVYVCVYLCDKQPVTTQLSRKDIAVVVLNVRRD